MKIYNQNIWGNFSSPEQCIANRNVLIKELIYEYNPDFCCFQECNPYTSRSGDTPIQDLLSKDYDEVSAKHSERNYTPIFYKRSEFNVKDCGYFPFKGLNDLNSKSVTWGVFEEKTNKKTIAVISTHFWWQSCNERDNMQRRENAHDVVRIARTISKKYNCAVIIAGDLNSGNVSQGTAGYDEMVLGGMIDIRKIAMKTDYSFTCSANAYPVLKEGKYVSGFRTDCTIDYMFVCGDKLISANSFSVINNEKARISSDHSPLFLEFDVK